MPTRYIAFCFAIFLCYPSLQADEPTTEKFSSEIVDVRGGDVDTATSADNLNLMINQSQIYDIQTTTTPVRQLTLHNRPLMRFNNPVSGVPDGIIAMWKDVTRPAVIAQVFQLADGRWLHETQSMAAAPLEMRDTRTGQVPWRPEQAGLTWIELSDVADIGKTPASRGSQMRRIASQFTAVDQFQVRAGSDDRSPYTLRLLPQPLYRYADAEQQVIDAAVFTFVHGTDPEMFLLLEAIETGEGSSWRYALAPMTCWAIEAKYQGQVVWNVDERLNKSSPSGNYHVWFFE